MDADRAYAVVFYVGGGVLLIFALVTRGAEGWAYDLSDFGLRRRHRVPERERALNPTGTLALAGVLLVVLGGVFDTVLR